MQFQPGFLVANVIFLLDIRPKPVYKLQIQKIFVHLKFSKVRCNASELKVAMRVELKFCYGHDQACRLEELLDNQTSEQLSPNQYQLF